MEAINLKVLFGRGCRRSREQTSLWLFIWEWFCYEEVSCLRLCTRYKSKIKAAEASASALLDFLLLSLKSIGKTWQSDKGDRLSSIWGRVSLFAFATITGLRNVLSHKYSGFWLVYVLENLPPNLWFQWEIPILQEFCNPSFRKNESRLRHSRRQ